jgi:hypothetical protein
VRLSLAIQDPDWTRVIAESGQVPKIFGVRRVRGGAEGRRDEVRIEPVCDGAALLDAAGPVGILHRNGFAYTSPCAGYDALIGHGASLEPMLAASRKVKSVAGDPFLTFLINQTTPHYGIPVKSFPLHIKEQEFRFNHGGVGMFPRLLDSIARYRPSGPER